MMVGRLVAVLEADKGIVRLALPLLSDSAQLGSAEQAVACACHALAGIASLCAKAGHK